MTDPTENPKDQTPEDVTEATVDEIATKVADKLEPTAEKLDDAQQKADDAITDALDDVVEADAKLQDKGAKEIEKATKGMSDEDVNRVADAVYAKLHADDDVPPVTPTDDAPTPVDDEPVEADTPPENDHWYFKPRKKGDN